MTTLSLSSAQRQQAQLEQFRVNLVSELGIGIVSYFYFLCHPRGPTKLKESGPPAAVWRAERRVGKLQQALLL